MPVSEKYQKYLKFHWKGNFNKFSCFPNGLCFCPWKFTQLIKLVHSGLRLQGHILAAYIDDNYIQGDTYTECLPTVLETLKLFVDLGFCAHPEKSCLIPYQEVNFLGVVLNSITMTVRLTMEKKTKKLRIYAQHCRSSPAVKGQNCSFFDKSIKLGRVTNLYKTNIS